MCNAGNSGFAGRNLMLVTSRPLLRMEELSITGWWVPTVRALREGETVAVNTQQLFEGRLGTSDGPKSAAQVTEVRAL